MNIRSISAVLFGALATTMVVAGPASAVGVTSPSAADSPREQQVRAYLDALITHDGSAVRFTPDARRIELGLPTGTSGPQMTDDLRNNPLYRSIIDIRDLTLTEAGSTVTANYLIDAGAAPTRIATIGITETFEVPNDAIAFIGADFRLVSLG